MTDLISANEVRAYAKQNLTDPRVVLAVCTVIDMVQRVDDMWEAEWLEWGDGWFRGVMCSRCLTDYVLAKDGAAETTCPNCGRKMKAETC